MFERIKKIRDFFNLTQKDFAKKIGISYRALQNYETGSRSLPTETVTYLYTHLGVNPVWLLVGEGEMLAGKEERRATAGVDAMDAIRKNAEFGIIEDEDTGTALGRREVSQEESIYRPERMPGGQERAAVIIQLLARILAAGKPKHVDMVVLYLKNLTSLIEDDSGKT